MVFYIGRLLCLHSFYIFLISLSIPKEGSYFSAINMMIEYYKYSVTSIIWRFMSPSPAMWFKNKFKNQKCLSTIASVFLKNCHRKTGLCLIYRPRLRTLENCRFLHNTPSNILDLNENTNNLMLSYAAESTACMWSTPYSTVDEQQKRGT